ncbi:hypothetical protein D3C76_1688640 [compost metagenome]
MEKGYPHGLHIREDSPLSFYWLLILYNNGIADLAAGCGEIGAVVIQPAGSTAVQIHGLISAGLLHHLGELRYSRSACGQEDQLMIPTHSECAAGAAAC